MAESLWQALGCCGLIKVKDPENSLPTNGAEMFTLAETGHVTTITVSLANGVLGGDTTRNSEKTPHT